MLDYLLIFKKKTPTPVISDQCPKTCTDLISLIPAPVCNCPTITVVPTAKVKIAPTVKTRNISFYPIPGSGSTLENKWTDIPGTEFTFSTQDYPTLSEVYFEANFKLFNANGIGYVRLYDATDSVGVDGSEIQTSSQSFTSISSGKINLRSGTHSYRIQAKSLTADTTVYNSGRLKLIF